MPPTSALQSIPRFSLRTSFIIISLCAVFFLIMGYAYRGDTWAAVITIAGISIFVTLTVHAVFYALVVALERVVGAQISPARTSQGGMQSKSDDQPLPERDATTDGSTASTTP